jgi:peptidoglycan hydrolase-like protein with peptidoglycan-binding domain
MRARIRTDSGETKTATYNVVFKQHNSGNVSVAYPKDYAIVSGSQVNIVGRGVPGNTLLLSTTASTCNTTVLLDGSWSCKVKSLQPGKYLAVVAQYTPDGAPNGVANSTFTVVASGGGDLCTPYITSFMKLNQLNNQEQVRRLQKYLNQHEGEHLAVSGTFGYNTFIAIKRYQQKYAQDILYPWGMKEPSGYVYKTTLNHINRQLCQTKMHCPIFTRYHKLGQRGGEIPKIQEFLRLYGYYSGAINGYFDTATDHAIRAFQEEFRPMVLTPWHLKAPTGNWYKTSRKHANWLQGCYERVTLEGIGITF